MWAALFAACLAAGCAATRGPAETAQEAGLAPLVLEGRGFRHRAYFKPGPSAGPLHVYIDHDGRPWLPGDRVAADPTPRDPLALRLMLRDPAAALYLGRPCHHGVDGSPPCQPLLWTHARYGEQVVASMEAAARGFLATRPFTELVLIGYSGGGTVALLLAERLPGTTTVVTVSGNLSVGDWARLHDYSPLAGSLDPMARPPLPERIRQIHYAGGRDENVPPALARAYAMRHPGARLVEFPDFDHRCCWESAWPDMLADFAPARRQ